MTGSSRIGVLAGAVLILGAVNLADAQSSQWVYYGPDGIQRLASSRWKAYHSDDPSYTSGGLWPLT